MMHDLRIALLIIPIVALAYGSSHASEEIAAARELECTVCHVDSASDLLTDQGLYYEYLRSLDGFEQVVERFGRCTYCHVDQAGSKEFTRDGIRFRWMMENMEGLKAWLAENHPRPTAAEEPESTDH